jgi:hypothetical protein
VRATWYAIYVYGRSPRGHRYYLREGNSSRKLLFPSYLSAVNFLHELHYPPDTACVVIHDPNL